VSIDRVASLKKAEKLLRQGRLEGAIGEYVRLVEDHPLDWNAVNALGDLYVLVGAADCAVTQFLRGTDQLFGEGLLFRAAALY
jgi:Flp pilus assembly protein TadD